MLILTKYVDVVLSALSRWFIMTLSLIKQEKLVFILVILYIQECVFRKLFTGTRVSEDLKFWVSSSWNNRNTQPLCTMVARGRHLLPPCKAPQKSLRFIGRLKNRCGDALFFFFFFFFFSHFFLASREICDTLYTWGPHFIVAKWGLINQANVHTPTVCISAVCSLFLYRNSYNGA